MDTHEDVDSHHDEGAVGLLEENDKTAQGQGQPTSVYIHFSCWNKAR